MGMASGDMPLFVYGTLMSGENQAGLLGGRRRESASVLGELYHLRAGYPALVLRGRERVSGELVYGIPEDLYQILDMYEGTSEGLYERVPIPAIQGLRSVRSWAFVMDASRARRDGRRITGRWTGVSRAW